MINGVDDYVAEERVEIGFIICLILLFLAGIAFTIWYLCSWDMMAQGLMIAAWVAFFLIGINVIPCFISEHMEEKRKRDNK